MYIEYTFLSSLSLVTNNEKLRCSTTVYLYDIHNNITLSYVSIGLAKNGFIREKNMQKNIEQAFTE